MNASAGPKSYLGARKHPVAKKTINRRHLKLVRFDEEESCPQEPIARPKTRGDCIGGERPCPFVSCKHHLYLDALRGGSLTLNFPDIEPGEMPETCTLDAADLGALTLEMVAERMNLTRERVRQIEGRALRKLGVKIR